VTGLNSAAPQFLSLTNRSRAPAGRDSPAIPHLQSAADHLEPPQSVHRQPLSIRRLQRTSWLSRTTVHDQAGGQRPAHLLGLLRSRGLERRPSGPDAHVLEQLGRWSQDHEAEEESYRRRDRRANQGADRGEESNCKWTECRWGACTVMSRTSSLDALIAMGGSETCSESASGSRIDLSKHTGLPKRPSLHPIPFSL
jgi:hypothetical protein